MVQGYSKQLKDILRRHGWSFQRPGKGDHEIWRHAESSRSLVVDNKIMSRHTANAVLKQAGLRVKL